MQQYTAVELGTFHNNNNNDNYAYVNEDQGAIMSPLHDVEGEQFDDLYQQRDKYHQQQIKAKELKAIRPFWLLAIIGALIFIVMIIPASKPDSSAIGRMHKRPPPAIVTDQPDVAALNITLSNNWLSMETNYPNRLHFEDAISGTYDLKRQLPQYQWVAAHHYGDGNVIFMDTARSICVTNFKNLTGECSEPIVTADKLRDPTGGGTLARRIDPASLRLSATGKLLLFTTDSLPRWRHSKFSRYWVYSVQLDRLLELNAPGRDDLDKSRENYIILAEWSSWEDYVAFVFRNDVYVVDAQCFISKNAGSEREQCFRRVTDDGAADLNPKDGDRVVYNGVADWVYEEEVLSDVKALWWSPTPQQDEMQQNMNSSEPNVMMLAFMKFDDTLVHSNQLQNFVNNPPQEKYTQALHHHHQMHEQQYTWEERIKYPKPGRNNSNPAVKLMVYVVDFGHSSKSRIFDYSADDVVELSLHANNTQISDIELIIFNVQWAPSNTLLDGYQPYELYVRVLSRYQSEEEWLRFALDSRSMMDRFGQGMAVTGSAVSYKKSDHGWFEPVPELFFVPGSDQVIMQSLWYDAAANTSYTHLALYNKLDLATAIQQLTQGQYEVFSGVLGHVGMRNEIFFTASDIEKDDPSSRYLYKLSLDGADYQPQRILIDSVSSEHSWYEAFVSPGANWIVLNYLGTDEPRQSLISAEIWHEQSLLQTSTQEKEYDNYGNKLEEVPDQITLPESKLIKISIKIDGADSYVSARLWMPLGLNQSDPAAVQKHPLLVTGYWGPNFQKVDSQWDAGFNSYLASWWHEGTLSPLLNDILDERAVVGNQTDSDAKIMAKEAQSYIDSKKQPPFAVLVVDVRGSGGRGSAFRNVVTKNLGVNEAQDIVAATKQLLSDTPWINRDKVAIFGWSYGGFETLKVVETQSGDDGLLFKVAAAVAPVTNWKYYDSVYTERYMKDTEVNGDGYRESAIHVNDNFFNTRLLVIHGSADDNVHFQNTMTTANQLQTYRHTSHHGPAATHFKSQVMPELISPNGYRVHIVPDDNHGMAKTPKAYGTVMRLVLDWIVDSFKEMDEIKAALHISNQQISRQNR